MPAEPLPPLPPNRPKMSEGFCKYIVEDNMPRCEYRQGVNMSINDAKCNQTSRVSQKCKLIGVGGRRTFRRKQRKQRKTIRRRK